MAQVKYGRRNEFRRPTIMGIPDAQLVRVSVHHDHFRPLLSPDFSSDPEANEFSSMNSQNAKFWLPPRPKPAVPKDSKDVFSFDAGGEEAYDTPEVRTPNSGAFQLIPRQPLMKPSDTLVSGGALESRRSRDDYDFKMPPDAVNRWQPPTDNLLQEGAMNFSTEKQSNYLFHPGIKTEKALKRANNIGLLDGEMNTQTLHKADYVRHDTQYQSLRSLRPDDSLRLVGEHQMTRKQFAGFTGPNKPVTSPRKTSSSISLYSEEGDIDWSAAGRHFTFTEGQRPPRPIMPHDHLFPSKADTMQALSENKLQFTEKRSDRQGALRPSTSMVVEGDIPWENSDRYRYQFPGESNSTVERGAVKGSENLIQPEGELLEATEKKKLYTNVQPDRRQKAPKKKTNSEIFNYEMPRPNSWEGDIRRRSNPELWTVTRPGMVRSRDNLALNKMALDGRSVTKKSFEYKPDFPAARAALAKPSDAVQLFDGQNQPDSDKTTNYTDISKWMPTRRPRMSKMADHLKPFKGVDTDSQSSKALASLDQVENTHELRPKLDWYGDLISPYGAFSEAQVKKPGLLVNQAL